MRQIILLLASGIFFLGASSVVAGEDPEVVVEKKYVVALSTDDFELEETDLSHLAVGDAETIVTESGKTIDLLRSEDGIEIYVDGELLDTGLDDGEAHGSHKIVHADVEIICEGDEECEETVWISEDGDIDLEALRASGGHKVIRIHEDEDHGEMDVDVEVLHEGHETAHKVIRIKHGEPGDDMGELHEAHGEKVIIIKKVEEDEI